MQGTIKNVLHSPIVAYKFLSVNRIQEAGMTIIFENDQANVFKNSIISIVGERDDNHYKQYFHIAVSKSLLNVIKSSISYR